MSLFATEAGFRIQLTIWNFAITGDKSEPIARLCEFREIERLLGSGEWWDEA